MNPYYHWSNRTTCEVKGSGMELLVFPDEDFYSYKIRDAVEAVLAKFNENSQLKLNVADLKIIKNITPEKERGVWETFIKGKTQINGCKIEITGNVNYPGSEIIFQSAKEKLMPLLSAELKKLSKSQEIS